MSRLQSRFAELKQQNRAALVTFVTAGDPNYDASLAILKGLPAAGADVIEDWHLDQIELDRDLWGGANLAATAIINTYGTVSGGQTVFDFGGGNSLTLQGHADLGILEAYIFDF